MKKMLVVLFVFGLVGAWALAGSIPAGKETIKFEAKMGAVSFPHKAHADKGVSCVTCHHTSKEGEAPKGCGSEGCHDAKEAKGKAAKLADAVHKNCWDCHDKTAAAGKKSGPVKKDCKVCHVKA